MLFFAVGKKESVPLPADVTLGDFQKTVEDMTRVPVAAQKVVHRYSMYMQLSPFSLTN